MTQIKELGARRLLQDTLAGQASAAALPAVAAKANRLLLRVRAERAHLFDCATGLLLG